jgi:hypothetical protein
VGSLGTYYLRTVNATGPADFTLPYSPATSSADIGLVGDWNGDGIETVGSYRPGTNTFTLSDQPAAQVVGSPTVDHTFTFGVAGDLPVAGDWDGDGRDSVGVYRPSTFTFYLRNALSSGVADVSIVISFAQAGDLPITGDWNGDGRVTPGMYRPSTGTFRLSNTFTSGSATRDWSYIFGSPGSSPITGDWDGDGRDSTGVFNNTTAQVQLRNRLTSGAVDFSFTFGQAGDRPLAGRW